MKLKFRKNKPPLKILEKGDRRAQIPVAKPGDPWKEIKPLLLVSGAFCPLCQKALTKENTHMMTVNGKPTAVHKTCPEVK